MKYNIRGEKIDVTESIRDYVIEKFSKINKYFNEKDNLSMNFLISVKNKEQKVEVTINTTLYQIRAEEKNPDLYSAIDLVIDKVERQIKKNKTKLKTRFEKANLDEMYFDFPTDESETYENLIKKRKNIELKPMDEEEAILQLELSDHDFYIFNNTDTESICVIYKRKDGYYGIMDTDTD
ncbi:ribosome-associated translation inhibitor RaiA [bacterium]|nr:ribosome-associated translation inhibitor RaiA [bacterium]